MLKIGDVIDSTWANSPIIFEFCTGSTTAPDVMQRAQTLIYDAHASLVHDNLEEPRDALVVESLMLNTGYRYTLTQADYFAEVSAGEALNLSMNWQNIGTAPAYPTMGYDFELTPLSHRWERECCY